VNKDKQASQRADKLISALLEQELDDTLHDRTRKWLLSAPEEGAAEEALSEWAVRNVEPTTQAPDRRTRHGFSRLASTLGLHGEGLAPSVRRLHPALRITMRAAAILLPVIVLAGGAYLVFNQSADTAKETILAVGAGETRTFILPDSTSVTMHDNSKLSYASDFAEKRNVTLDGEAFFIVTPNIINSFTVQHEQINITVTGTEFNVDARHVADLAEIILNKGGITVEAGDNTIDMKPGDKLTLDKLHGYTFELTHAGSGEQMRVSGSNFTIDNITAIEAMRVAADYFGKTLTIEQGTPSGGLVTLLAPDSLSLEEVLTYIDCISESVTYRIEGDTIIASKK
jgi:ferric-dicitrate binding protein FerR (iron transport regulator)